MKIKKFLENFILFAIVLVIIQTFLDELAVLLDYGVSFRNSLIYAGLVFDIIFTIEFFTRLISASKKGRAFHYFFYERGWVDFIASVPLLILNSGPTAYVLFTHSAARGAANGLKALNILKVVKAVRITRVLRLIRILKIFGKIKNANSVMAQRHVTFISTLVCSTVLVSIISLGIFGFPGTKSLMQKRIAVYKEQINGYLRLSSKYGNVSVYEQLKSGFASDTNVIKFSTSGNRVFNRFSNAVIKQKFKFDETEQFTVGQIKMTISIKDFAKQESRNNIVFFTIIVTLIISLMIFYSRHFVQTVSDVVHVMNRGFTEPDYFLEVKLKQEYINDEIFDLAKNYNEKWLTYKLTHKNEVEEDKGFSISVEDFFNE